MRLRVQLDKVLAKEVPTYEEHHKFWWQPSSGLQTVDQLLDELASHLAWHRGSAQLVAELDGFAVLPSSSLGLLREGDLLTLKHNPRKRKAAPGAEPAAQPAGKKPKVGQGLVGAVKRQQGKWEQQQGPQLQRQLQQEPGSGSRSSDTSSSSSSSEGSESEQRSESSPETSSASESSPESSEGARQQADVDAKSERFYTPAAKLVSPGIQQRASAGEETLSGRETGGTATGEAAAGKPRPSRSARRKAVKRRLKREGLLPPSTGKKVTAQPPPPPQQQQQKQRCQQQQPGKNGGGPDAAPATGGATAPGGDQAAGHGAQPAQKQQNQQHQRQPRANGSTKPADGLVAAPEANAYSPHPAVLHQPARHAGTRLAPAPPPGKAAAVAKAAQRRQAAEDMGSMLHASGIKARNITPDGHVYFADDSGSSDKSELSSDHERDGNEAAHQQLAAVGSRQKAADLAVARTGGKQVPVPQADGAPGAAAAAASAGTVTRGAAALPQPMAEFEFARLKAVRGMPSVGSVVAYKLLEMGPSYAPQVSEVRLGRIVEADGQSQSLTLEPHPDPATHPLARQWAAARAVKAAAAAASGEEVEEADEEEEEQELGLYEEDGMLAAELSSFVELRLLDPAAPPRTELADKAAAPRVVYSQGAREPTQVAHAAATASAKTAVVVPSASGAAAGGGGGVALEDLGPSSYSQLGPPRSAGPTGTGGTVIPAEGGWASLHQQLQQRRAELARQQQQEQQRRQAGPSSGAPKSATPANSNGQQAVKSPLEHPQRLSQQQGSSRQATPAAASPAGTHTGEARGGGKRPQGLTPGATKPRGGVRASAMGPILRMLRSSNELE